jgi:Flp pilus assembly protein TadD
MDLGAKRPSDAVARVKAALERSPDATDVQLLAAQTYAAAGDLAGSEAILRRVVEAHPDEYEAYSMLGQIYIAQRRLDQARLEYEELAKRRPASAVGALTMAGIVLQAQGKTEEARQKYEQVLATAPRAPVAANNLAWIIVELKGNLDQALSLARTAQAAMPYSPEVSDTIGWIYYHKKLTTLAVRSFREAIDRTPANPTYHYHLGLAHLRAGDTTEARQALQRALKLNPQFSGAADARDKLASIGS